MSHILLVEDDTALREGLTELFTREGYAVISACNAAEAKSQLSTHIDLIILDVTLPDGNGVSLCQEWRDQGITTSILFLTAKDEEFDVVRGLDAGGNDYVTKPFRMMELLSRIRALLRRNTPAPITTSGELEIDPSHMQVRRDGEIIPLTLTEYKVLTLLRQVSHELGITLVLVTHDLNVAEQAERIIQLEDGHIARDTGVVNA